MRISIDSNKDIDYYLMNTLIDSAEKSPVSLTDNTTLDYITESGIVNNEQIIKLKTLVIRRNRQLDKRKSYEVSTSGAHLHMLKEAFDYGILHMNNHSIVKINLATCFLQIIETISNLGHNLDEGRGIAISSLKEELNKLFSGECKTDGEVQDILHKMIELDSHMFNLYFNKAVSLAKEGRGAIVLDAFGIEKTYSRINTLTATIVPISNSFNHLVPAVIEQIEKSFRKTDKRFGIINEYCIYYFVKNTELSKFMNLEFYLNDIKLNILMECLTHNTYKQIV